MVDVTPNGRSVSLKTIFGRKPILVNKVFTVGSHKVGYLMYNGFAEYDTSLNTAFGSLKASCY
jgi:hypothetical protein